MNKAIEQLNSLQLEINEHIDSFFKTKNQHIQPIAPALSEFVETVHHLCQKGKRLRAAYVYFGYLASGGNDKKKILDLCSSIELIHSYFLIHDDIMDQDVVRRGMITMHAKYEKIHKTRYKKGSSTHFGESVAIIGGDMASAFGYDILANSNFSEKIKIRILNKMNSLVIDTMAGQFLDIKLEVSSKVNKRDIMSVLKYKTAKYTIEGPLHIGAIAADKNVQKNLNIFSDYAIPLGIAFQIRDDILGIFGSEEKLGKPVGSDIRENKHTILIHTAFERANSAQKKVLKNCLGNDNLTKKQIEDFRQVIVDTGSLDYATKEVDKLLLESLGVIKKANFKKEGKDFLIGIGEYLVRRES
ncbi:MAG: polyprenyl synthetase family protein [bacterium]